MTAEGVKEIVPADSSSSIAQTSAAEEEQVQKLMDSDKDETLKTALNSLVQGKRHLLVKDFMHACSALGDACKLLAEVYGPISGEHADAHMYYGKALLEQARQDLSVFHAPDAKEGEEDSEEDEDEDEEEEEGEDADEEEAAAETAEESPEAEAVGEAEAGPSGSSSTSTAAKETAGSLTETAEEDLSAGSPKPGPSNPVDDEQPSTSKGVTASGTADETMGEEELSNLELAWEVFEIAKLGYKKQMEAIDQKLAEAAEDKKAEAESQRQAMQKKIADTHAYLGEVSIESENYERAIEDLMTAVSEYEAIGNMPREIAQCYFHIGLAHGFDKKYADSIDSFEQAVKLIQTRIDDLKSKVEEGAKAEPVDKDSQEKLQNEIKELDELIPELKGRINDTLEQEQESKKTEEEEKMEVEVLERNSPVKNPNPPAANDISHLVKKKRKLEVEPDAATGTNGNGVGHAEEVPEPPRKKASTSDENGATNGHATPTTANGNGTATE